MSGFETDFQGTAMRLAHGEPEPDSQVAGQATFGMSNLRPETTGLDFIVFVSQRDAARHGSRVKWSPAPRVQAEKMGSYSLNPFAHQTGPRLNADGEKLLRSWVSLNLTTLQRYWDGEIEYTEDMLGLLQRV